MKISRGELVGGEMALLAVSDTMEWICLSLLYASAVVIAVVVPTFVNKLGADSEWFL